MASGAQVSSLPAETTQRCSGFSRGPWPLQLLLWNAPENPLPTSLPWDDRPSPIFPWSATGLVTVAPLRARLWHSDDFTSGFKVCRPQSSAYRLKITCVFLGLPWGFHKLGPVELLALTFSSGSVVKKSSCNAGNTGDMGSIPGLAKSPGGGNGNPLQYSCLENPIDRGA